MTREEALRELKIFSGTTRIRLSANFWEALNMAIKALEQEPILDKIRAEIEEQKKDRCFDDEDMFVYRTGLDDALYIIDKYKAESEREEG